MKRGSACIFVFVFFFCAVLVLYSQDSVAEVPLNDLEAIKSDEDSIILKMVTRDYQIEQEMMDDQIFDIPKVEGCSSNTEWGHPQLPSKGTFVGIPIGAQLGIRILSADYQVLPGEYKIRPVPTPGHDPGAALSSEPGLDGSQEQIDDLVLLYEEDPNIYGEDSFYPKQLSTIADVGFLRDQRFARVVLYPFQYNPVTKELRYYQNLTIELTFSYPNGRSQDDKVRSVPEPAFEPVLLSTILNYDSAKLWRGKQTGDVHSPQVLRSDQLFFKILVDADGIYRLTRLELEQAGVPVSDIDPNTFRLYNHGDEVAIRVFENGGVLDSLLFYGQKTDTQYTDTNVYWLTYGGSSGLRMNSRSASPSPSIPVGDYYSATVHLEENLMYSSSMPWSAGDHWWWGRTYYPYSLSVFTATVVLSDVVTLPYSSTLRVAMHSMYDLAANPDHCVQFSVNNHSVGQAAWNGQIPMDVEMHFSSYYLQNGVNIVHAERCATAAPFDLVYYNWFEIDYRDLFTAENGVYVFTVDQDGLQYEIGNFAADAVNVYDVTDPRNVSYLTGFTVLPSNGSFAAKFYDSAGEIGTQYWILTDDQIKSPIAVYEDAPSDLANPANQADYLVIAPDEFMSALDPLIAHRQAEGLTTMVVDVQDIYDEFNWGVLSPVAIHDFLSYAFYNWTAPAPTYVVLAGDGHYDYKNYLGYNTPNPIPPYLSFVDRFVGEMPIDNWYVSVSGGDRLPDMYLGRLPAETAGELSAIVSKIIAYEDNPPVGDWNRESLFAADKNDPDAGNFPVQSRELVDNYYPVPPYTYTETYIAVTCPDGYPVATVCRQEIIDFFNRGGLFVHYVGHAGPKNWTDRQLFDTNAIGSLVPNDKLPVSFDAACSTGYFVNPKPGEACLGESLVRAQGKGAIGNFSMTGFGTSDSEHYLSIGFMDAIFFEGVRELGQATLLSRLNLYATGHEPHLLDTYTLFGDPALHINALDTDLRIQKTVEPAGVLASGDVLTYTLTFTNAGPAMAHNVVLTDLIPSPLIDPVVVYSSPEVVAQHPGVTFTWDITDLLPHTGGQIRVRATVDPAAYSQTFVNRADTASRTPDTDASNNTARLSSQVGIPTSVPSADVRLVKTVEPAGPVNPGDVLTYTLTFYNDGPDAVEQGFLSDFVPSSLLNPSVVYASSTVVSQTVAAQPRGTAFKWAIADLLPYASGEIQMRAVAGAPSDGGFIVNEAEIESSTPDVDPSNNVVSVTVGFNLPDLFVSKTGPDGIVAGQTITYTIAWGNAGVRPTTGVRLTDTLPAGVTYVSDSSGWLPTEPSPGVIAWSVTPEPVPTDTYGTFVLTGSVALDLGLSGPLDNRVAIASDLVDGAPLDNEDTCSTNLLWPDLGIQVAGPGALTVLTEISHTITYSNSGDGVAQGVIITQVLPAGLTYLSDDSGVTPAVPVAGTYVWDVGQLPAGAQGSFTVTLAVGDYDQVGTALQSTLSISADTPDENSANNSDLWTAAVLQPDLAVHKAGPDQATTGSTLTYTLAYSNAGAGPAFGVVLTDLLPAGLSYLSDDSGLTPGTPVDGTYVWQVGDLPGGGNGTFHLVVQVGDLAQTGPAVTNTLRIGADSPDAVAANDESRQATSIFEGKNYIYLPLVLRAFP